MLDSITVEKFIRSLKENSLKDFPRIIKNTSFCQKELNDYASWESENYTRNCLARNEKFELILLCWEPGAKTPIHDHGGEKCWVYQISGIVEELRYRKQDNELIETNRMNLIPGTLAFMNDQMGYHSIENNSNKRALTLHIYAHPIDQCSIFNDATNSFETKILSYDKVVGSRKENLLATV